VMPTTLPTRFLRKHLLYGPLGHVEETFEVCG
jgi:hypothetical protein